MMDRKSFAIGVLAVAAVVLFVGYVLVSTQPTLHAAGMNASGGDYLMLTGQVNPSRELLYVIDAGAQKVLIYRYDVNRKDFTIEGIDLAVLTQPAPPPQQPTRRGRGRRP